VTEFEVGLIKSIKVTVRKLRREGTVRMSVRNLMAVTPPLDAALFGTPCGSNAQWAYAELFRTAATEAAPGFAY
jgi:hypothetical protein